MNAFAGFVKVFNFKKLISYLPEISFLFVACFWFMDNLMATSAHVNYFMMAVALFVLILIIWRNRTFAVVLSVILGTGSFYMFLAVLSEFNEFPKGDPEGLEMVVFGLLIFITLMVMSVIMPKKYKVHITDTN